MLEIDFDLDYQPKLGTKRDYGIGIVGAGEIVNMGHLPAYRRAGFNVVGITSRNLRHAEETARHFGVPKVYPDYRALMADDEVQVVDIAYPATLQPEIAILAARHSKHLLCQKPLADNIQDAGAIIQAAEKNDVKLAVNQNGRWDPAIRACKTLIQRGLLGVPTMAIIESSHWSQGIPWLREAKEKILLYSGMHYLDAMRFLFGEPEMIHASGAKYPEQEEAGETLALVMLEYAGGLRAFVMDNGHNWTDDVFVDYRFDGTEGVIKGRVGVNFEYPMGEHDTLYFTSKRYGGFWLKPKLQGKWIPDALIGTMGELFRAIEENREPENSGTEHMRTLQLVFAAYKSMRERRGVLPSEIV